MLKSDKFKADKLESLSINNYANISSFFLKDYDYSPFVTSLQSFCGKLLCNEKAHAPILEEKIH